MNIICFHNPNEENGYLSNWYLSDFSVNGIEFTSMEQFMMYRKAVCFKDKAIAKEILATEDVAYIKKLGRLVFNYNENIWNGLRQLIVYEGLQAKFTQNSFLRQKFGEYAECNTCRMCGKGSRLGDRVICDGSDAV